jgi:hypothetical protein
MAPARRRWPTLFSAIRDAVLLLDGLALLVHETVLVPEPRLPLLAIAAASIGLPPSLLADRLLRTGGSSPAPPADDEPSSPTPARSSEEPR